MGFVGYNWAVPGPDHIKCLLVFEGHWDCSQSAEEAFTFKCARLTRNHFNLTFRLEKLQRLLWVAPASCKAWKFLCYHHFTTKTPPMRSRGSDGEGDTELALSFLHPPGDPPPIYPENSLGAVMVTLWTDWNTAQLQCMTEFLPMFQLPKPHFDKVVCEPLGRASWYLCKTLRVESCLDCFSSRGSSEHRTTEISVVHSHTATGYRVVTAHKQSRAGLCPCLDGKPWRNKRSQKHLCLFCVSNCCRQKKFISYRNSLWLLSNVMDTAFYPSSYKWMNEWMNK